MPLLIRSLFPNIYIGTLDPISGLVQLKHLNLSNCQKLTGMICCSGTNRELTHWLISRVAGSSGGAQPIKIARCFFHEPYWLVSFRNLCVNNQTLTRLVEAGELQPLQNLNLLTELNLGGCEQLTGAFR